MGELPMFRMALLTANNNDLVQNSSHCPRCLGADPQEYLKDLVNFVNGKELIFESHYGVSVCCCPDCDQHWIIIWTERIDWEDGNDDQDTSIVPLTKEEAETLVKQGENVSMDMVEEFARNRKWLHRYNREEPRWRNGQLSIGFHS